MCDMCSSPDKMFKIELEGTQLNVCEKCSSYGKIIGRFQTEQPKQSKHTNNSFSDTNRLSSSSKQEPEKETETIQLIVSDYSKLIKKAREDMNLKQEELARKLAEKESVIHSLESNNRKPNLTLARKLEKFLKITLVEEVELTPAKNTLKASSSEGLTLGDMIKIKKR